MKKHFLFGLLACLLLSTPLTGCSTSNNNSSISITSGDTEKISQITTYINLNNNNIKVTGDSTGVSIDGNKISILAGGTYSFSGTLDDSQIIVDTESSQNVSIVLNGVNLSCSNNSPIYIKNAHKTVIGLADNTKNYINDGSSYTFDEKSDEPNAAIYSKDDLVFIGNGSLEVNGNYDKGINGKDDIKIENGNITVNSKGDAIRGKDSLTITNGNITINSGADGLKSNNDTDEGKGNIYIKGGTLNITSAEDSIQGENIVTVDSADINIVSGGGSANAKPHTEEMPPRGFGEMMNQQNDNIPPMDIAPPQANNSPAESTTTEETISTKGIKAGSEITINSGNITIDSCDDAIHSNNTLTINGGTIELSSGDDGLHADTTLNVNNGNINILKSYEGIESETINLNNGTIHLVSSDDGINASGKSTSTTETSPAEPGSRMPESSGTGILNINGGYIFVDASGDGLDANGSAYMTDGTVLVCGPTNGGNGALDYDDKFEISGGTLIVAGSSGMAQSCSDTSTQNFVSINLSSQPANTIVDIQDSNGNNIITFAPSKTFEALTISSPDLKTGETYTVYTGGTMSSESQDGLYSNNGIYSNGTKINSFTISSVNNNVIQDGVTINTRGPGGGRGMGDRRDMMNMKNSSSSNKPAQQ